MQQDTALYHLNHVVLPFLEKHSIFCCLIYKNVEKIRQKVGNCMKMPETINSWSAFRLVLAKIDLS